MCVTKFRQLILSDQQSLIYDHHQSHIVSNMSQPGYSAPFGAKISSGRIDVKWNDILCPAYAWDLDLTHWAETKWARFSRWYFQMHFLEWKCLNSDYNFTEVCSQMSNWQYPSIGSDNDLAPNRRQAIIWTNDVLGCRRIYVSLDLLNELKSWALVDEPFSW